MPFLHRSFLFGGILWIVFSLGASVLWLFALQLDELSLVGLQVTSPVLTRSVH